MSTMTSTLTSISPSINLPSFSSMTNTQDLSFPHFPRLPLEVRQMIWNFAFLASQPPRLIEIQAKMEENLFWDVDCENIIYPKPTGSRVVRWSEIIPRDPVVLESVCRESKDVVERSWDWCFSDLHDENVNMIELESEFDAENGSVKELDGELVEKRLGRAFKRGIKFLSDRDTIYFGRGFNGIPDGLKDATASTLKLGNIKKFALGNVWADHYLINKQLFDGWEKDREDMEEGGLSEEPMLKSLKELVVVMDDFTSHDVRILGQQSQFVIFDGFVPKKLDETQLKRSSAIMLERFGEKKNIRDGRIDVKVVRRSELESFTTGI